MLDVDVRELITQMLNRSGWKVLVAQNEAEALDIAGMAEIDLLLVEMTPALHGRSVAERLRAAVPGLSALYVTGWQGHPDFLDFKEGDTVLTQPFTRDELTGAIAAALGRDRAL